MLARAWSLCEPRAGGEGKGEQLGAQVRETHVSVARFDSFYAHALGNILRATSVSASLSET
jgi:hypothetical protein